MYSIVVEHSLIKYEITQQCLSYTKEIYLPQPT